MDAVQSWSSFEQQQRNNRVDVPSSATDAPTPLGEGKGIDALYVFGSSPDVAPAAAWLLRHSGLNVPGSKGSEKADDGGFEESQQRKDDDEEFRLRFHWMRPHPSLAFALEEELMATGEGVKAEKETEQQTSQRRNRNGTQERINPAIESSKLMGAYLSSQMKKQLDVTTNGKGSDGEDQADNSGKSFNETEERLTSGNPPTDNRSTSTRSLPLELPKLRINLASLIEPPLMSSWLPGEDAGISYDSDDGGDGMDE